MPPAADPDSNAPSSSPAASAGGDASESTAALRTGSRSPSQSQSPSQSPSPSNDAERRLDVVDLGGIGYEAAYAIQMQHRDRLVAARKARLARAAQDRPEDAGDGSTAAAAADQDGPDRANEPMTLLLLEHIPPVITVGRRPGARDHLVAAPDLLDRLGIEVCETDRGGDITYHGPGQLVGYPILDLNMLHLGLHGYMRLLEAIIIRVLNEFGIAGRRDLPAPETAPRAPDPAAAAHAAASVHVGGATGVWVDLRAPGPAARPLLPADTPDAMALAKICALGVRVSKWVTMHGFALNITTNLDHFHTIVPCGLAGRPVTSLERLMCSQSPPSREHENPHPAIDDTTNNTADRQTELSRPTCTTLPSMQNVKAIAAQIFEEAVRDPEQTLEIGDQFEQANQAWR